MIKKIDDFLNRITMYRLVLYYLIVLVAVAVVMGIFGAMPVKPLNLVFSSLFLLAVCFVTNAIFAKVFRVPANVESVYITALILALIINPSAPFGFLLWVAILSMASKYILAPAKKHIFNPAAFAVALTALTLSQSANWWIGNQAMFPFVLIGGLLVVRKIRRFDLVLAYAITSFSTVVVYGIFNGSLSGYVQGLLFSSPFFFFASIMITEPLTTPPTRGLRIVYGALVGFLFAPFVQVAGIYSTPELALLVGNIFSYIVSPKRRFIFKLKEKIKIAPDIYDFIFTNKDKFQFKPGQYLEWTLAHNPSDSRGNRRYFTVASSPTENEVRLGVKFVPNGSSFKQALFAENPAGEISASSLAGDFTLPKNPSQKIVFMAGGIGVTPFRSMAKYLSDTSARRDIVMFYSNKIFSEIAYKNVFDEAQRKFGMKTIYTLTDVNKVPVGWAGRTGRVTKEMIVAEVSDYKDRIFYLSGPRPMVIAFEETLKSLGVSRTHIKKDFFPGFV